MSRLDLFCSVDDFWQQFAPNWHRALLVAGQRQRLCTTQMHPSELMTLMILFHQSHYRTWKRLFHRVRPVALTQRVPHEGSLSALRRVDAHAAGATGGLPPHLVGSLHRHQLYRLDLLCRLPPCPHSPAPRVCWTGRTRQDLGGLVLRLQAAPGRE
jgi:hypothetical protein